MAAPGGAIQVDCGSIGSLPTVSFDISGTQLTLTPFQYVLQVSVFGNTQCILGFMGIDIGQPIWILVRARWPAAALFEANAQLYPSINDTTIPSLQGDIFLSAFHSIFDYGNSRVGFATAA